MTLLIGGLAFLLLSGVAPFAIPNGRLGRASALPGAIAGALLAAIPAVVVLAGGETRVSRWASALPGGDWVMVLDPLAAVFVLVILLVGSACLAYGVAYHDGAADRRKAGRTHFAGVALVASLVLVVTAGSVTLFMVAWELMAITSFVLIMTEHERTEVRRAGLLYLVLTHTATLALFVMFAVWTRHAPDWSFGSLAAAGAPAGLAGFALFASALAGFGMKAGLVPAHFWLPPAHAAAPSHVSAIMSGLVIKTGIYGLLRVVTLAGPLPVWWGWALLIGGAASAVGGVLWALAQHDIKRLLAFHSVENIGIIAMGAGLGALGTEYGHPTVAVLGYGSAILHTVNHAIFKALLFLTAGAVQRAAGTRELEHLGGLAKRMPHTWAAFAIGAAAIVGLPPLNGFVSEWLLFAGLFGAAQSGDAMRVAVLGAPALALVGGLALACFSKVAGVAFLGHARVPRTAEAREVSPGLRGPAWLLAGACVVIGLAAAWIVPSALAVGASLGGVPVGFASATLDGAASGARGVTVGAAGLVALIALIALVRRKAPGPPERADETWDCGWKPQTPRMQYTASSFAGPLLRAFGALAGVREHRGATLFHSAPHDIVLDGLVRPAWSVVQRAALRLRPLQQGRLHVYLLYVVATLVALLAYGALAPQGLP